MEESPTLWQKDAICKSIDNPDIFHPDSYKCDDGAPTKEVLEARKLCAVCPVKLECLQFALDLEAKPSHAGRYGVWAGTTPEQRVALVALKLAESEDA